MVVLEYATTLYTAMLWSPKGLESFASFIEDAYASSEETKRRVKEWGSTFPFCRPPRFCRVRRRQRAHSSLCSHKLRRNRLE